MKKYFNYIFFTVIGLVVFALPTLLKSQNLGDYYKLAEKKLKSDKKYLNIYAVPVEFNKKDLSILKNVPKLNLKVKSYSFEKRDGVNYIFEFLGETLDTDSLTILQVFEEIDRSVQSGGGGLFDQISSGSNYDTTLVLSFGDIQNLYFNNKKIYIKLYKLLVNALEEQMPNSLLGIPVDDKLMKSKGISGKNNQDFLNYNWVNSSEYFPRPVLIKKKARRGRRKKGALNFPYHVEADFSHATFYDSKHLNLGFSSIGAEWNSETKVLNLLPWQSMTMSLGVRTFISFSEVVRNLYDDFLINAKILTRFRLNTSSFSYKLPFVYADPPRLNVLSALVVDVNTTRIYGLPFMNFYFASGFKDFSRPYVSFGPSDSSRAFFNTNSWEYTMSFFWNKSERLNMRFKIDIGMGAYDVYKVIYHKGVRDYPVHYKISPVLNFYFTFVPQKKELFGMKLRYFDSMLRGKFWLKIFELDKLHTFRFQVEYISKPMFRQLNEWENTGAAVQLVYRLGF